MKTAVKRARKKQGCQKESWFSSGFTLLEIVLVLAIIGVASVSIMWISNSLQNMSKVSETKQRMTLIAEKAKDYYRGQQILPGPDVLAAGPANTEVPIDSSDLDLEQKYRLDAWGQYLYYFRDQNKQNISYDCSHSGAISKCLITIGANKRTLIRGLEVNDKRVAGVLISKGPNQILDTDIKPTPQDSQGSQDSLSWGKTTIYKTRGDDIVIPINVTKEAMEIAIDDLLILQNKVNAFNKLFESVDNNSSRGIDDESNDTVGRCPGATTAPCTPDSWICPFDPAITQDKNYADPRQGTIVLDHIMANKYLNLLCDTCPPSSNPPYSPVCWDQVETFGNVPSRLETMDLTTRAYLYLFYQLQDDIMIDPWLNGYLWGCGSDVCNNINGKGYLKKHEKSDKRYHKFYSAGPDGLADPVGGPLTDDIFP